MFQLNNRAAIRLVMLNAYPSLSGVNVGWKVALPV